VIISDVPDLPLDRPNLSKDYLAGKADPTWMPLRPDAAWYAARDIDLRLKTRVTSINPKAHQVTLDSGRTIAYSALLLATGAIPRTLPIPGADLGGVFLLRKMADADQVIEAAAQSKHKQAVIVGASFIGMEAAAALVEGRGITLTVVDRENVPFAPIWGNEIGKMLQKEHEDHGVQFRLGSQIKQLVGKGGAVTGVELESGEVLPADFVLMGVGVRPATDFLSGSGLKLDDKDKSVRVDASLLTSEPDVYAAGDIACWSDGGVAGSGSLRIEHWRVAEQQGIVAARNMLGGKESVAQRVPFFWTHQWSVELRYAGHAEKWDEIIYRGTLATKQFIAFFVAGGKLLAAAACDHDADLDAIEFILRDNMALTPEQMRDPAFDLVRYAHGKS
jgi:NADPH-dependent 2,4-dienoyl-CoA reductase/sulfur reductase-like enzyme